MRSTITDTGSRTQIGLRVVRGLNVLAEDLSKKGFELFVFGSVAQTYPLARKGADLDLGICAKEVLQPEIKLERMRHARREIQSLPTIRPVDLVDFDTVGADFKELALRNRLDFPLVEYGRDDTEST
jgi:hypothetical protein